MPPQPESDDLAEKVLLIIAKTQRIPPESVTLDSTFEDLKIDSLDGINIVFELEKEFSIDIPDEGVSSLRNVRDTVAGVRKLVEQKERPIAPETV